ncbi:MAG TPA: hypothetical protein ENI62_03085 [Gammaproteobacteria bacterium]|nr:hypothetical protein [Gammaproteobacteria bacterium]
MTDNLWQLLSHSLLRTPEQHAWLCRLAQGKHRFYRYRQIHDCALDLADRLRERGVNAGDKVGVLAPNGPEWGVAALAVWKIGAILAPIHTGNSIQETDAAVTALDPKLVLVHGAKERFVNEFLINMETESERVEREYAVKSMVSGDQEALRVYTSGSTGTPKMVRLSHHNLSSNAIACAERAVVTTEDRFLSLLPLSHTFELTGGLLLPLMSGSTIVLPRVLAAAEILQAMKQEQITVVIAVPRLFRNIMQGLSKRVNDNTALRTYVNFLAKLPMGLRRRLNAPLRRQLGGRINVWVSGGSRLDPEISGYFRKLGIPLMQGYGLTETAPVICVQWPFDPVLDCVGPPLRDVEVRIIQPDANGDGELWVKGPNVMLGYVDDAQTADVMDDGWFATGDIAHQHADGRVMITGRSKRLIVTEAGKNVYPEELETRLERIGGVKEAAVLEVEMKPVAVLVMDALQPDVAAREALKEHNAMSSKPNQILRFAIVEELPKTPLGKIALQQLPELFVAHECGKGTA